MECQWKPVGNFHNYGYNSNKSNRTRKVKLKSLFSNEICFDMLLKFYAYLRETFYQAGSLIFVGCNSCRRHSSPIYVIDSKESNKRHARMFPRGKKKSQKCNYSAMCKPARCLSMQQGNYFIQDNIRAQI